MNAALPAHSGIAARMLAVLCAGFVASQFFRVSNAVIAPELMRTLSISSEAMGVITGAFFLAFGLMQVPTGVLLDRFGPRRTMSGLFVIAAAGSAVFAMADGAAGLTAGRALIGAGCAAGLMGMLVTISRWYPPERFARLSSMVYVVGGAGVLFATTPLAAAADTIGWRGAFWVMAVVTLGFAAMIFALVRDAPPGTEIESARETLGEMLAGVGEACANRQLWHVCAIQFVNYGTILAIVGLWAGPYLNDVHGMKGVVRGNVLLVINLAMLAGVLGYGVLERRLGSRKRAIAGGSVASAAVLLVLALWPGIGAWPAIGLLVAFTLTSAHIMLNHAHARAVLPDHLVGRGLTLQNVAVFFGVATMQGATGPHRRPLHRGRGGGARHRLPLGLRVPGGDDRDLVAALPAGARRQDGVARAVACRTARASVSGSGRSSTPMNIIPGVTPGATPGAGAPRSGDAGRGSISTVRPLA